MANARVMSPSRSEIATLRTPLTAGELEVLNFFDSLLAIEWEIYVQPFLNGLRPDFVLLNPRAGVAVFEDQQRNLLPCEGQASDATSGRCDVIFLGITIRSHEACSAHREVMPPLRGVKVVLDGGFTLHK